MWLQHLKKQKTKKETNIYKQKKTAMYNSTATLTLFQTGIHTHTQSLRTFTHTYSSYKHRYSIRSYIFTVVLNIFFIVERQIELCYFDPTTNQIQIFRFNERQAHFQNILQIQ